MACGGCAAAWRNIGGGFRRGNVAQVAQGVRSGFAIAADKYIRGVDVNAKYGAPQGVVRQATPYRRPPERT